MPPKQHTYQSLQLLRFIAALLIVCFHVGLLKSGYKGVDLFFVISGFVIYQSTTQLIGTGVKNGLYFFIRRAIRIFIPYWSVLLVLLCTGFYNNLTLPILLPLQQAAAIFLLPGHIAFFEVTWSLSYELYFYALYTLVIFLKIASRLLKALLTIGLVTTCVITVLLTINPAAQNRAISFLAGHYLWEFLLGIAIALVLTKLPYYSKASFIVSFIILAAFICINIAFNNNNGGIVYGLLAAATVMLVTSVETHTNFKLPRLLVIAGDASYITYLIHVPVREVLFRHVTPALSNKLLYILLVQILSVCIHLVYEKWILRKANNAVSVLVFGKTNKAW